MRLIDADDLKTLWEGISPKASVHPDSVIDSIKRTKTIETAPVTHAHWVLEQEDTAYENVWTCSNCGEEFIQHRKPKFIYCPHCGAKMDEEPQKEGEKNEDD